MLDITSPANNFDFDLYMLARAASMGSEIPLPQNADKHDLAGWYVDNNHLLQKIEEICITSECSLLSEIPQQISVFTNLKKISIYRQNITQISQTMCSLSHLTTVSLSSNKITHLPEVISNLTNLKELILDKNLLYKISTHLLSLKSLTTLSLNNNKITTVPDKISLLTNLKHLKLKKNKIESEESISFLFECFRENQTTIKISNIDIKLQITAYTTATTIGYALK